MEHIAQQIAIYQVELSAILGPLETSCINVTLLFGKLSNVSNFSKEINDRLSKIDEDLKESAQ